MDEKDLLIKQLQAQLQSKDEQLENKDEQLNRMFAKLQEASQQHVAVSEQFVQQIEEKDHQIALLEQKIKKLLSTVRGSRQERINPDQLLLFSTHELQQIAAELEASSNMEEDPLSEADESQEPITRKAKRRKLPSNMPKEVRRYELSEEQRKCPCCGELHCEMGVETSQQIEFIPAVFKIIQHQRVQYACKACQGNVAIAPKPPQPI